MADNWWTGPLVAAGAIGDYIIKDGTASGTIAVAIIDTPTYTSTGATDPVAANTDFAAFDAYNNRVVYTDGTWYLWDYDGAGTWTISDAYGGDFDNTDPHWVIGSAATSPLGSYTATAGAVGDITLAAYVAP